MSEGELLVHNSCKVNPPQGPEWKQLELDFGPNNPASTGGNANTPIWSSTKAKTPAQNAFSHWKSHGPEFPEFQNAKQYMEGAKSFFNDPPAGTLTKTRANGDKLFYDPATNTFGVQAANGAPRTLFRPTAGINYWNNQ